MDESPKILVVDDNKQNLAVVSRFLKEQKYRIALAMDGPTAISLAKQTKPNLILLDVMMPGMDGFEVCTQLKNDETTAEIPIIFLTAKVETSDLVKGFGVGAVDYLTKPFNRDELLVRVSTHLELAFARNRLKEMNRTRDKLYSIIAHDIRSPFAGILQTINSLAEGYLEPNSEEFTELMVFLQERTQETSNLLENLLQWTKVQSDSIVLEPINVNLYVLLADCMILFGGNAKDKNIAVSLKIPDDLLASCDEVTVHTVFRNLISNAIKFTPPKGGIAISARPAPEGMVAVSVSDTGVGMPQELIRKIFEEGRHHTSTGTHNEQGTGLGLVMVRDFVHKNKGGIQVDSIAGKGTSITVMLPVGKH